VLHCVAVYGSVLQCGAVCCSALQRVTVCCVDVTHTSTRELQRRGSARRCSMLQRVAACCSVLQCVAGVWLT